MKKINKVIGYSLSILSIVLGIMIFGVGVCHLILWFSDSFFYLVVGVLLLMIGVSNVSDIKEKKI